MKILDIPRSGSVAGETSSRNRSGQYVRTRAMPVQPRTASQQQAKARFANMSIGWRGITDAQRAAWSAFAGSFTVINSLGSAIHLTGHQCYVKVNSVLNLLGTAALAEPPALPSFGANPCTAIQVTFGTQLLALTCGTVPTNTKIMVYGCPAQSVGRSFAADWRYLASFSTATANKLDVTAAFTAKFGSIVTGKRYFLSACQVMAGMQDQPAVFQGVPAT